MPGPPDGVLDLAALATVERRLRWIAAAHIDEAERIGGRSPAAADAERAAVATASSVATVLWFDALRAEDRVSVTPRAAPLVHAVHRVLADAGSGPDGTAPSGSATAATLGPANPAVDGRSPRALGAGNVGPAGTVWAALARRYAGDRFDHTPQGRQICLIDYAELRDPTVWETVTDERVAHLGELFWVVLVSRSAPAGPAGGVGGPTRAARMFEAAGWQVLTVRYGRALAALFQAPGGHALHARLDRLPPAEYRALLNARGEDLRRRLAGPGTSGVGISRLLDTLTDDQILACLRDLGGHDIPLLIDAFDDVAADRPTVLFAYTSDVLFDDEPPGPAPAATPETEMPETAWSGQGGAAMVTEAHAIARRPDGGPSTAVDRQGRHGPRPPAPDTPAAARLSTHVASYLDRAPVPFTPAPPVPAETGRAFPGWCSTQQAFGEILRDLPALAPQAAAAVVTISTRDTDPILAGWLDAADRAAASTPTGGGVIAGRELTDGAARGTSTTGSGGQIRRTDGPQPAGSPDPAGSTGPADVAEPADGPETARGPGHPHRPDQADRTDPAGVDAGQATAGTGRGRHVAGSLSPGAFGGVLASLGVAWSRQGLPLLPIGVADEVSAGRMLPGWIVGGAGDARSLLAVADTGLDPVTRGLAWNGGGGIPTSVATSWEPAFAVDLAWCLMAGLDRLARLDGRSGLIRLSARHIDQRLADLPTDAEAWHRRRALVLAGGYRLRDGGPAPVLTLVGMGPVMPEVLQAADELTGYLGREVAVVCVTSSDAMFTALQARRGLAAGSDALLAEVFPESRRGPMVTVVDGDPRALGFLAGVHGEAITTLGSAAPPPGPFADPPGAAPVEAGVIIGAALDLLDETSG